MKTRRAAVAALVALAMTIGLAESASAGDYHITAKVISTPTGECLSDYAQMWWSDTNPSQGHMTGNVSSTMAHIDSTGVTPCYDHWHYDPYQLRIQLIRFKLSGSSWAVCSGTVGEFGDGFIYNHTNTWNWTTSSVPSLGDSSPCSAGTYKVMSTGQRNNGGWAGGSVTTSSKYFL